MNVNIGTMIDIQIDMNFFLAASQSFTKSNMADGRHIGKIKIAMISSRMKRNSPSLTQ